MVETRTNTLALEGDAGGYCFRIPDIRATFILWRIMAIERVPLRKLVELHGRVNTVTWSRRRSAK
jgi:hypothetical protein